MRHLSTSRTRKIVVWNAAGSTVYALSSFLLLIIVTRACGEVEAGIFSIGYAIAQLMLTVGVFEATTYFATDAANRFTSEQYLAFKILTCMAMVVASIIYVATFNYDTYKEAVALALCAFRLLEAFSQFYYAAFQKVERLDISGFSTVWRMVLAMAVFAGIAIVLHDVFWAVIAATVMEAVWIVAYDMRRLQTIKPCGRPDFSRSAMAGLFRQLLPLFICSFLATYLANAPKYAIDNVGTEQMQTIFNVLFMPSFVINLFMIFIMRPTLTTLAARWLEHGFASFKRTTVRLLLSVAGITAVVVVVGWLIGIPLLELFYGVDLADCMRPMLILLVGGGFSAAATVIYNDMVILRKQAGIVAGYLLAVIVAVLVATPLVASYLLDGASYAYLISCTVLFVSFLAILVFEVRRAEREYAQRQAPDGR